MIQLYFLLFILCFVLSSCSYFKKDTTSSIQSDQQFSIDTLLHEDESFISDRERMHAKEFSRLKSQQNKIKPIEVTRVIKDGEQMHLHEAKLADIPIPIHAKPLPLRSKEKEESETISLSYLVNQTSDDLDNFYLREMERCGWQLQSKYCAQETLLTFCKPERICAISIRPKVRGWSKSKTEVIIFSRLAPLHACDDLV